MNEGSANRVSVRVELFGGARAAGGVKEVEVSLPASASSSDVARALRRALPNLVGVAIDERGEALLTSYTANLNGLTFMDDSPLRLAAGDSILVFSSQAGG